MESIRVCFSSWLKWFVFMLPWESSASGWWKRVSPLLRKPCVAGRLWIYHYPKGTATFNMVAMASRGNNSQTTKKVWQPLKDLSPQKFPNDFFPQMSRRRKTTHKKISADGIHREERLGLRQMTFSILGVFCFCDLCGSKRGQIGICPRNLT